MQAKTPQRLQKSNLFILLYNILSSLTSSSLPD